MKMLVCLHGNPLQGQEFEHLFPVLRDKGIQPVLHKRPLKGSQLEPLLHSVSSTAKVCGNAPFALMAYSWGAYLALAYLLRFPENVTSILLINPLVTMAEQSGKTALMQAPILRAFRDKFCNRSLASSFVESRFLPLKVPEDVRSRLITDLSQALAWRGERAYQKLIKNVPLSSNFNEVKVPVRVIAGVEDEVAPLNAQLKILKQIPACTLKRVKGAGHALPWTHADLILKEIEKLTT